MRRTNMRRVALVVIMLTALFFFAGGDDLALAHPGGVDANGGHINRKTGENHGHRAPFSSESQVVADPVPTLAAQVFVMKVIDGDTLKLSNGETVRLIGVDTPETVHPAKPVQYFGKEASAFTKRLAEGKAVRLEYDQQRTEDKYGRTLAYVYIDDGRMLNSEIIMQGYGFAYTKFPFKRMEEFRALESEAREAR